MTMPEYIAHTREDGAVQRVDEHLRGTARLAAQFAADFDAKALGAVCGLLHDIGKYSGAFQARIRAPERHATVDHSTAGAKEAYRLGLLPAAFAVAGHHAGLPDGGSESDGPDASTLLGRVKRGTDPCEPWRAEVSLPEAALPEFCMKDGYALSFFTRMLYSCLVDADFLDTETFMMKGNAGRAGTAPLSPLLEKVRARCSKWLNAPAPSEVDKRRCEVLRACAQRGQEWGPGLFTLTVPTGGGKTVASLRFALEHAVKNGLNRVIYVIPYTSIIDQTARVFCEILGEENVLAHYAGASYQLQEKGSLSPEEYRKALAAENWDAPVIVTTAVQFFESLYANRSSRCRKLHNIAKSVVIFDEAQTLPVPYLRPCIAAIGQLAAHYRTSAVFCTATQPALGGLLEELAPGLTPRELCPRPEELFHALRRTTLKPMGELSHQALADAVNAQHQALCVVNRRSAAQEIYSLLAPEGCYCLTTLLCPADRTRLLEDIRRRLLAGETCRVVSTSLIEAGVDVDFPAAYREEAGLDSVLQTAGRCNREGRRTAQESVVGVFSTVQGAPDMLAQNISAFRAVQRAFSDWALPDAVAHYFHALFSLKGPEALDAKQVLPAFRCGLAGSVLPFAQVAEAFHLIDAPMRTVYVPIEAGAALCEQLRQGLHSRALFRALGRYGISVYAQHFAALRAAGALAMVDGESAVLADLSLYSRETGLALDVEDGQGFIL